MSSNLAARGNRLDVSDLSFRIFGSEDKGELTAHYMELSAQDQRARFMYTVSEVSLKEYVEKLDFMSCSVFGAYCACAKTDNSILMGVVQLGFEFNQVAEVALSVCSGSRRLGYGLALMNQVIAYAKEAGYCTLKIACLGNNVGMYKLAKKVGFVMYEDEFQNYEGYLKC